MSTVREVTRRGFIAQSAGAALLPRSSVSGQSGLSVPPIPGGELSEGGKEAIAILFGDGTKPGLVFKILQCGLDIQTDDPNIRAERLVTAHRQRLKTAGEARNALITLFNEPVVAAASQGISDPTGQTYAALLNKKIPETVGFERQFVQAILQGPADRDQPWLTPGFLMDARSVAAREKVIIKEELNILNLNEPTRKQLEKELQRVRDAFETENEWPAPTRSDETPQTTLRRLALLKALYSGFEEFRIKCFYIAHPPHSTTETETPGNVGATSSGF